LKTDNSRHPLLPPGLQGKAHRADPYTRDAFSRWPAASPQVLPLPHHGANAVAVPDLSRCARLQVHQPVGFVVALVRRTRRGRAGAGWVRSPDRLSVLGPVRCQPWRPSLPMSSAHGERSGETTCAPPPVAASGFNPARTDRRCSAVSRDSSATSWSLPLPPVLEALWAMGPVSWPSGSFDIAPQRQGSLIRQTSSKCASCRGKA
jgi:hypothetical protein